MIQLTNDVLAIPQMMMTYTTIVKSISYALIPVLFVGGILIEQAKIIQDEKPEFLKLILNTLLTVIVLRFAYDWLFLKMVAICEAIGMSIFSYQDWYEFKGLIGAASKGTISVMNLKMIELISSVFVCISIIVESVFEITRYSLLCFLYIVGPLSFVAGIFPFTRTLLKGWFLNVFQISFWIVTLRILEATMLSLKMENILKGGDPFDLIVVTALFIAFVVLTPIITAKLLSGSMGTVGIMALTMVSVAAAKYGSKVVGMGGRVSQLGSSAAIAKRFEDYREQIKGFKKQLGDKDQPKQEEPRR